MVMTSAVARLAATRVKLPLSQVNSVVSLYSAWVSTYLKDPANENTTVSYAGLVEMSPTQVRMGLCYRDPLKKQLRDFAQAVSLDVDLAETIIQAYSQAVLDELVNTGQVTLYGIGLLKTSPDGLIRFWSSCSYNRQGYSLISRVNPDLRRRYNEQACLDKAVAL